MAKQRDSLESIIAEFCRKWGIRRPDFGDKTVRKIFAQGLAREINDRKRRNGRKG